MADNSILTGGLRAGTWPISLDVQSAQVNAPRKAGQALAGGPGRPLHETIAAK